MGCDRALENSVDPDQLANQCTLIWISTVCQQGLGFNKPQTSYISIDAKTNHYLYIKKYAKDSLTANISGFI